MGFHDFIDTVKKVTGTSDAPQVSAGDAIRRVSTCRKCNSYFKPMDQCLECGCIISKKAKYADEHCKLGKW